MLPSRGTWALRLGVMVKQASRLGWPVGIVLEVRIASGRTVSFCKDGELALLHAVPETPAEANWPSGVDGLQPREVLLIRQTASHLLATRAHLQRTRVKRLTYSSCAGERTGTQPRLIFKGISDLDVIGRGTCIIPSYIACLPGYLPRYLPRYLNVRSIGTGYRSAGAQSQSDLVPYMPLLVSTVDTNVMLAASWWCLEAG